MCNRAALLLLLIVCKWGMGESRVGNRGDKDGFTVDDSLQRQVSAVSVTLLSALSTEWIKLFSR